MLQLQNRSDQKLLQELAAKHAIFSRNADLLVSGQESDTASLRRSSVQLHELLDRLTDKQAVSLKTRMQEASRHE
jgi:hypothetical protein